MNILIKLKWILIKIATIIALILGAFFFGKAQEKRRNKRQKKLENIKAQKQAWRQKYETTSETSHLDDDDIDKRLQQNGWLRQ